MTIYRDTYGESLMVRIERLTRSANEKHERIDGTHRSDRQRCSPICRFAALLSAGADFEFQSVALAEISTNREVDVVLLGGHPGKRIIDALATVKAVRPGLDVIGTGCNLNDAAILNAVSAGAKGCVDEAASVGEHVQAIRTVLTGSVWAPRRVLSMFVDQAYRSSEHRVLGTDDR